MDEADEVVNTIAKTVAELTRQQDAMIRQRLIEHLIREVVTTMRSFVVKKLQVQPSHMHGTNGAY
jgi:hypothetical protein